jgi:D-arabinose 1-dehydrogenase-like Zn-dependent alcohol dehydrogenase
MAEPRPGPGEVLVLVEACGVGLTVLNCINGDLSADEGLLPRVPGHELVGRVVEVGEGVASGILGRRGVAYFYLFCGVCGPCSVGLEPRCEQLAGFIGVHRDGGYAPFATLAERHLVVIPDTIDPLDATVIADAVATPVHVAGRAGIGAGDRVAVIGAGGGVGIHMVQVARHCGATVAGLDLGASKLALVDSFGASAVSAEDLADLDPGLMGGRRPSVVVDLVGTAETTAWSLGALDMGGRLVTLTTFRERPVHLEHRDLVLRELTVLGSRYANRSQVEEASALVAAGYVRPVIGATSGPSGVLEIHERLRTGQVSGRGALDWSNG